MGMRGDAGGKRRSGSRCAPGSTAVTELVVEAARSFLAAIPRAAAASCAGDRFFGAMAKVTICESRANGSKSAPRKAVRDRAAPDMDRGCSHGSSCWRRRCMMPGGSAMGVGRARTTSQGSSRPAGRVRSGSSTRVGCVGDRVHSRF